MNWAVTGAIFGSFLVGLSVGIQITRHNLELEYEERFDSEVETAHKLIKDYQQDYAEDDDHSHSDEKETTSTMGENLEKPKDYTPEVDYSRYSTDPEEYEDDEEELIEKGLLPAKESEEDEGIVMMTREEWDNRDEIYDVIHLWYYREDGYLVDLYDREVEDEELIVGDAVDFAMMGLVGPEQTKWIRNHDRKQDIELFVEWGSFLEEEWRNRDKEGKAVHLRHDE